MSHFPFNDSTPPSLRALLASFYQPALWSQGLHLPGFHGRSHDANNYNIYQSQATSLLHTTRILTVHSCDQFLFHYKYLFVSHTLCAVCPYLQSIPRGFHFYGFPVFSICFAFCTLTLAYSFQFCLAFAQPDRQAVGWGKGV